MACDAGGLARGINRDPAFPHYGSRMKRQMRYILDNVAAICEAGGTSLENVVHQQTFYTDFESYTDAVDEWAARFPQDPPATVDVCTGGPLLVPGCDVILNLIAHVPEAS
jgi:enamine deaminase RidA (YjgF/YER057c/UK114 family)